ncbi:SDR family oxidoreductase [Elizabethkingia anophelis]|uniref:NAD(P)-dependent oxidoreductase n=1 Tax=Elizabethkingia anophelis R26 TaxID=1246994 RepID=A0ABN5BUF7_9FLAO|nr:MULTISPECIES: SDR family oxidoreductase [Elizabethkingia]ATC36119.1 NAD(P)-dependent oxidoreductase [Elizabethkingia anophelis R26]ATC39796.1 NAD(P)-dependent oxidoreductase [Elizabethkingia anophelis Ag1]ATC43475.1 NAD(P)-dependent oxidoreductase [Elizabethkingia anophelis]ATC47151.1 NAD(P)-dependent oxidoreductase [Elizabethkingia anophelis]ELR80714.1 gluconate 5-dehydrogenase [Elizabethkingia anophelis R26]
MNPFSLENKTILVTGATSGIGFEVCKQIHLAGGNFIGLGRNTEELDAYINQNSLNGSSSKYVDVSNADSIIEIVNSLEKIDGFVHSAGIVENNPIQFFNNELYEKIRMVNLDAVLIFISQLLKKKKFNKPASIVFVSSISGLYGMKGNGLYGITKAGLGIMAKTYANELSSKKIRVNTVAPGMVNTKITAEASSFLSEEVINEDKKKYPLGYGEPEDVALPIVFLLSEASRWITGQDLILDGGRTAII